MTPWVRRLLIANVVVFFVQTTMPGVTYGLAFTPALVLQRPWTIVTYAFLHGNFMHILFNMIGLFFFGPRVELRLGERRFFILYSISGVSGALLSLILAPQAQIIGASACVFGVMMAFAYFWPREIIYIWGVLPVPAALLVVITTVLALMSGLGGSRGGVADFAHLGGYAGAFLYLWWIGRAPERFRRKTEARAKAAAPHVTNWKAIDLKSVHEVNRDEVNRILDKISASGIDSLTANERTFLSNFVPPDDRIPPPS